MIVQSDPATMLELGESDAGHGTALDHYDTSFSFRVDVLI
jgi:hypothetical protein